jgi:hypothetical protein
MNTESTSLGAFRLEVELNEACDSASAAYDVVTSALQAEGYRFAAYLREAPPQPEPKVVRSMNTLWAGGDLGG